LPVAGCLLSVALHSLKTLFYICAIGEYKLEKLNSYELQLTTATSQLSYDSIEGKPYCSLKLPYEKHKKFFDI